MTRTRRPSRRSSVPAKAVGLVEGHVGHQLTKSEREHLREVWRRMAVAFDHYAQRGDYLARLRREGVTAPAADHIWRELNSIDALVLEQISMTPGNQRQRMGVVRKRLLELAMWTQQNRMLAPGRRAGGVGTIGAWFVEELINTKEFPFRLMDRAFVLKTLVGAIELVLLCAGVCELPVTDMPTDGSIRAARKKAAADRKLLWKSPQDQK